MHLAPRILGIRIDYFILTRTANHFLRRVRRRISQELGIDHPVLLVFAGDLNNRGLLYIVGRASHFPDLSLVLLL